MKTFYDVVNYLKGDLEVFRNVRAGFETHIYWCKSKYAYHKFMELSATGGDRNHIQICSIKEFNKFIAKKEKQYAKYKKEFEMSKTVTHEGKVYEIGKRYLFSNGGNSWVRGILSGLTSDDAFPLASHGGTGCWKLCKVDESEVGIITDAPIELVVGGVYEFDTKKVNGAVGRYYISKRCRQFFQVMPGHRFYPVSDCTNVTRLVPEVK